MNAEIFTIVGSLLVALVLAQLGWIGWLTREHSKTRSELEKVRTEMARDARDYVRDSEMQRLEAKMDSVHASLQNQLNALMQAIAKVEGRMAGAAGVVHG